MVVVYARAGDPARPDTLRDSAMKEAEIKDKLADLHRILRAGPIRPKGQVGQRAQGLYEPVAAEPGLTIPESLDQLRLQLKYLLFDLEATKRENRYLRQMLETRRGGGSHDPLDGADPAP